MTGIKFITDEKGRRTDVVINLRRYSKELEDFFDHLVFEERKQEETVPFEKILDDLKQDGRYDGK
ncbi:hypothetical protein [Runella sp.]|jgi:hypothetical protein|uniref:hypothetical protein n=1 Tax=Runella sp. TaxID=1960881 RepID=UPI00260A8CD6|nr:hypothetical protein [Runella sp.]